MITVVGVPRTAPSSNARAKTALVQSVSVKVRIVGSLNVTCAEDNLKEDLYNGAVTHGSAHPSSSITTGSGSHGLTGHRCYCRASQCTVCAVPVCVVIATAILSVIVDKAAQCIGVAVYTCQAVCGYGTDGNTVVVLSGNRAQGNFLMPQASGLI